MEKQKLYSVRYKGQKHTLTFWSVGGVYMYSVDNRQQLKNLDAGYKRGRISKQDYTNITVHGGLFV